MIYLDICGRLGNQLFQYAFAKKVSIETGHKIAISFATVEKDGLASEGWEDALKYFKTEYITLGDNVLTKHTKFNQFIICFLYYAYYKKILRNQNDIINFQLKMQPFLEKNGICWLSGGNYEYDYEALKHKSNIIIKGNFENEKFFSDIRPILKNDFEPKQCVLEKNRFFLNKVMNSNSVCVSVRRGDFFQNKDLVDKYGICEASYFQKAVEVIKSKVNNPVFFMFSDDINWVKENIRIPDVQMFYEDGTDPVWEKLRLMYSCKHFILSNSTFSWWAQYLAEYDSKIVVSPKQWTNDSYDTKLLGDEWILL